MELLRGNVKTLYFKYLGAAFGSALVSSVYGIVDMAMVGQYQGPGGTAALAVVAPVWNIVYSLGLLTGIGGSVLFSTAKGSGRDAGENEYFTVALLGTLALAAGCWLAVGLFDTPMLLAFGAEKTLLPLAKQYLLPVKFAVPLFLFNQMLAAFLRNDGDPGLATAAVLAGGAFNVAGDYFFVFALDMGVMGAGLATALGALITFAVMLLHFLRAGNSLRLVRVRRPAAKLKKIVVTGFSTFFTDVAMGILTMLFNRQIVRYLGTDALAVYGVLVNISTVVQCCAYSVGQAAQPILSVNFGAQKWKRIGATLRYALCSAGCFGAVWLALILAFPEGFIRLFMAPTDAVLRIAPFILRSYGLSFPLLVFNVFSTFYFQAVMRPGAALGVSVARGLLVSGALIWLLPLLAGAGSIWFAMPITEAVVGLAAGGLMVRCTKKLAGRPAAS